MSRSNFNNLPKSGKGGGPEIPGEFGDVPAEENRAIVRLFHHGRQDCTLGFALLICHWRRLSSAGLHDNAFTFVVVVERGCAADHANLISFISCRPITLPPHAAPTGERKSPASSARCTPESKAVRV